MEQQTVKGNPEAYKNLQHKIQCEIKMRKEK